MSKARVYTDVNVLRPKEYWDYEALTVQWGSVISSPPLPSTPSAARALSSHGLRSPSHWQFYHYHLGFAIMASDPQIIDTDVATRDGIITYNQN
jgi:hypothetical protein